MLIYFADNADGVPYLLFRVYDHASQGINRTDGFHAGRSSVLEGYKGILEPNDRRLFPYAANHFERWAIPTPFISLTTSFI